MKKLSLLGLVVLVQALFGRVDAKDIALESGGDIAAAITELSGKGGTIENCIFWDNTSDYTDPAGGGSEISFKTGDYDSGYNYTFRSTAVPKTVTSTVDGLKAIDDPCFADAANGDYRLTRESPCRNVLRGVEWARDAKDLDGNDRIYGPRLDLGCYELSHGGGTLLLLR